jgi:hypothetical protein
MATPVMVRGNAEEISKRTHGAATSILDLKHAWIRKSRAQECKISSSDLEKTDECVSLHSVGNLASREQESTALNKLQALTKTRP